MKQNKPSILDNRRVVALLSLLAAILAWMIVTMYIDPDAGRALSGVPVDFSYDSARYTALGLDIVNQPEQTVTVRLEGNGTTIGQIRAGDVVVYPDYSAVRGAGECTLNLLVRIANSQYSNGVTATIDGSVKTIDVVFDTVVEKTLPIAIESSEIELADGYVLNRTSTVPTEVTLTGPESELENITSVVAGISIEGALAETRTITSMLELRDADGNTVTPQYTTLSTDSAEVVLTVYQLKELPLAINFINVPSGFDVESLHYTLSQETMRVAGPERTLEGLSEISVASFDLSTFALDRDYQLAIQLPSGLISQEGLSTVTLSFDTSELASKTLNVPNIRIINAPTNYDISVDYSRVNNVTLIGPAEELEALAASQVEAQINAEDITVSVGQQNVPVSIVVPSSSRIFAVGSYTIQCTITAS